MAQALYRKHRPKKLSEIVGQEHITKTLQNALKDGRISHAYLFTGPKGVGKTSIARILAHEINDLPYTDDSMHMDIIEIDAASNRRIDEIRDLRDKVHIAPTSAKYKVYIIDEVHMLTPEAFNALLKTLEEPPAHVVFILATTEAHKLPETIISRTQRFSFKPIEDNKAVGHLRTIAESEKINITDEALTLLAEHGRGSFRDSISLLDQITGSSKKIDIADVQDMLGIAPEASINALVNALQTGTPAELLNHLTEMRDQGFTAGRVAKQLSDRVRQSVLGGTPLLAGKRVTILLQNLLLIPTSPDPFSALEIVLLEELLEKVPETVLQQTMQEPAPKTESRIRDIESKKQILNEQPEPSEVTESTPVAPITEPEPTPTIQDIPVDTQQEAEIALAELPPEVIDSGLDFWPQVLSRIKKTHNTLYGVLRMARPRLADSRLILAFDFPFHQKQMSQNKNKQLVIEAVHELTGKRVMVECVVEPRAESLELGEEVNKKTEAASQNPSAFSSKPSANSDIETITNIFGGGELLQS